MLPHLRTLSGAVALGALTALALVANAGLALRNVDVLAASGNAVARSHQVMAAATEVLSALQDAETGQRGFVITGEEKYLAPWGTGLASVDRALQRLDGLVAGDEAQARRVAAMRPRVGAVLGELERTIVARRTEGFAAARRIVLTDEGKREMDALRALVADLGEAEQASLQLRQAAWRGAAREAALSAALGLGASLGLLAAALIAFRARARERGEAAARLHRERELLRTTLTSIGDAVLVTDVEGRISMLNPVARDLLDQPGDVTGRPLSELFRIVNETTRLPVEDPVRKVLQEGRVVGLANHTMLLRPDGSEVPIDDSAAPVRGDDGLLLGVVLVFRGVAERRAAERELRLRSEQLLEADRRKDRFLATLSHELRNPLAPIRNALALLGREGATPEQVGRARAVLDRQVAHLARLVDDLLDVSRIAEGKIRLERERFDLGALVRATVDDHRDLFAQKGVAVELRVEDGIPVDGDATRVAQVVGNVLANAAKFTPGGGRVAIAVGRQDGRAAVRIRDSGAGIDPVTLERLFEPFVQAPTTLDRTQGGLGLGLALSKGIVELHGGRIQASSEGPGRGAEFAVLLPLGSGEGPARARAAPSAPAGPASARVLLVEDNADAADTLRELLELDGHAVTVARGGLEGVQAARAVRPDVILCDVGLPGIDGYEVARRLRADGSGAVLVALSGYARPEDVGRAREAGFDHHLAKPPDLARLRRILEVAVRAAPARPGAWPDGAAWLR